MRKVVLLLLAGLLAAREVMSFSQGLGSGPLWTFLDVFCAVAIVLIVANAFGFREVSWTRTVGPCLAALVVIPFIPRQFLTPGFRMARWAEQSPWHGYKPPILFIDVDPYLIFSADLLVFTTMFSLALVVVAAFRSARELRAKAA